jgi:hypothetical protein
MLVKFPKLLLSVGISATTLCVAQSQSKNPSPLLDSSGHVRQDAYVSLPVPAADRAYEKIDGRRIKEKDMEVVAISHQSRDAGDRYWGRIAGTKYEKMTAEWAEAKWRQYGLTDIHEQEYPLDPQWFGIDWNVTATGSGKTLTFKSLNPAVGSASTPPGGLEAEAVWVGTGSAADFMGRDVRGKAALILSILEPGNMGESAGWEGAWKRAADHGAAAIITIWGYNDNLAVWQGISGGRGNPINVPGFFLGWEDGKALRDLIALGDPVKVKMNLKTEMRKDLKAVAAYGTLPGTTDESIYVLAHTDGYYEAALGTSGDGDAGGVFRPNPQGAEAAEHHLRRQFGPPRRIADHTIHARPSGYDAREDGADSQLRARLPQRPAAVEHAPASVEHHSRAPMVGLWEQPANGHRAEGVSGVWRQSGGRNGSECVRGYGAHRARRAIHSSDRFARNQAHRRGHPRARPGRRPGSGGARLRENHRRSK